MLLELSLIMCRGLHSDFTDKLQYRINLDRGCDTFLGVGVLSLQSYYLVTILTVFQGLENIRLVSGPKGQEEKCQREEKEMQTRKLRPKPSSGSEYRRKNVVQWT